MAALGSRTEPARDHRMKRHEATSRSSGHGRLLPLRSACTSERRSPERVTQGAAAVKWTLPTATLPETNATWLITRSLRRHKRSPALRATRTRSTSSARLRAAATRNRRARLALVPRPEGHAVVLQPARQARDRQGTRLAVTATRSRRAVPAVEATRPKMNTCASGGCRLAQVAPGQMSHLQAGDFPAAAGAAPPQERPSDTRSSSLAAARRPLFKTPTERSSSVSSTYPHAFAASPDAQPLRPYEFRACALLHCWHGD